MKGESVLGPLKNIKKYALSRIGEFHINHNEDAFVTCELDQSRILLAVMDGCSMGTESHFSSTLIAKLLRKISKELSFLLFIVKLERSNEQYLEEIMKRLFSELAQLKKQLLLKTEELLSTLILAVLNTKEQTAEGIAIGDGLICCNAQFYEYEQDDKPDYLGYHLTEDFDPWFRKQTQRLSLQNIHDLSLASDGIFTFKKFNLEEYPKITDDEIMKYFLLDREFENPTNMLDRKLTEMESLYGLKPSDDLTIIRVILDPNQ